jgi:3-oxoacyl-[acyl-carrier protein] reductase
MVLKDKNTLIYGAGGAIGSAVARAFAREGAKVFLTGRNIGPIETLAKEISATGGAAETDQVDALDEKAVEKHAGEVAKTAGGIDVSFNLISVPHRQGMALVDLVLEDFAPSITNFAKTHFLTARAAARHMAKKSSGVILMMTTTPDRRAIPLVGTFGMACAAIEAFCHTLAAEVGAKGIRVVCLRSSGSPETPGVQKAFETHAKGNGMTFKKWLDNYTKQTMLRRLTTVEDVAKMAVFLASDQARAVTGTAVNLTCGAVAD